MNLVAGLLLAFTIHAPASAAEPEYEGTFVTHCLPTATCSFNVVDQGGGRYKVDWLATDRTGRQTYCEVSAVLSRGPAVKGPDETFEEAISGPLPDGAKMIVVDMGDEAYAWVSGSTCQKQVDNGWIAMNGFYDRFYGDE